MGVFLSKQSTTYYNLQRESEKLEIQDGFNADASMGDDTWTGSLLGSLVGVLGGP